MTNCSSSARNYALGLIAVIACVFPASTLGQPYPSKPIRLMVGAPPGGTTDIVARMVAVSLGDKIGQAVVVENRGGAGGNIANDAVAKAASDGYTLGLVYSGLSINPLVMSSMPFDTLNDLAPVSLVATVQMFLIVDAASTITSVQSLINQAKANPGRLAIAASSPGTVSQLSAELFKMRTGADMITVIYKGSAPAWVDLMGGRVSAMFDTVPGAYSYVKSGKMRALAVGGRTRSTRFPDVPTLSESGLGEFEIRSWYGVVAPAKTPPGIVMQLSNAIAEILKSPAVREKFAAQQLEPVGSSPEEFANFIRAEMREWQPVVKAANIHVE